MGQSMKNKLIFDQDKKIVTKEYRSNMACAREAQALRRLTGTSLAPELIQISDHTLTMTYCPGESLAALTRTLSTDDLCHIYCNVAAWLLAAAEAGVIQEDVNPANFLLDKEHDQIIGIDLEDWSEPAEGENKIPACLPNLLAMIQMTHFADAVNAIQLYENTRTYILERAGLSEMMLDHQTETHLASIRLRRQAMPHIRKTQCLLLAGGKSSRMGTPKALLELDGYTFLDHMIQTTRIFDHLAISANDSVYDTFHCLRIPDIHPEIGPMGAIHAGLTHLTQNSDNDWLFLLPCDMPFLRPETLLQIFAEADWDADCNIVRCGDHDFPTVGLYHKRMLPLVETQIASGNYRLMRLLDQVHTKIIPLEREEEFQNINTPEEYQNMKKGQL